MNQNMDHAIEKVYRFLTNQIDAFFCLEYFILNVDFIFIECNVNKMKAVSISKQSVKC
jgi:hypothetical protein